MLQLTKPSEILPTAPTERARRFSYLKLNCLNLWLWKSFPKFINKTNRVLSFFFFEGIITLKKIVKKVTKETKRNDSKKKKKKKKPKTAHKKTLKKISGTGKTKK